MDSDSISNRGISTEHGYQKPGRYVGREWNQAVRNRHDSIESVLVYPDVYDIGMSHYGLHLLYSILARSPDTRIDRCFLPWPDYENFLERHNRPLSSLETHRPLSEFDCILITLPHELAYTNVLNVIRHASLPLRSSDRRQGMPYVIGGGICGLNPVPLEPFFDAFVIGDADAVILKVVSVLRKGGGRSGCRTDTLDELARLDGVFVPSIHRNLKPTRILKTMIDDLETAPYPDPYLTPIYKTVHNRVVVEAARGCPRRCRFCQARVYYGSPRLRSADRILEIAKQGIAQSGFDEVSLLGLSIADYPRIDSLLKKLMDHFAQRSVSISLPSLRPEKLSQEMITQIRHVRKSGFTLAPEAGTDRLRRIIGKPYDTDRLLSGATSIFQAGWSTLKLYFMAGQPFETDQDLLGISDIVRRILTIGRRFQGRRTDIHVSVAAFIPKPHTPFQWRGQASRGILEARFRELRKELQIPGVKISLSDLAASRIEAFLARGGSVSADVLEAAFYRGCRFDSWQEMFSEDLWIESASRLGVDLDQEAMRQYETQDDLPWSFIDPGLDPDELTSAYESATRSAQDSHGGDTPEQPSIEEKVGPPPSTGSAVSLSGRLSNRTDPVETCFAFFQIRDDFRLFGHLDIAAEILRAARRADLPLAYSQGFNPHARFSFAPPTPLGFEHFYEPLEFHLTERLNPDEILDRLNRCISDDMAFSHVAVRKSNQVSLMKRLRSATYGFSVPQGFDSDRVAAEMVGVRILTRKNGIPGELIGRIPDRYRLIGIVSHGVKGAPRLSELVCALGIDPEIHLLEPCMARLWWNSDEKGDSPLVDL